MGEVLEAQAKPRRDLRRVRRARRRLRQARRRAGASSRRSSPPPAPTPTCRWKSPPTRCACRRGTRRSATLSGGEKRRVALCRLLLSQARHAAARRADQPPRRRERRVARAVPARNSPAPWSRSPTTATSSTTPPSGSSSSTAAPAFRRRATTARGSSRRSSACETEAKQEARAHKAMKKELEWVRANAKGRQAKSKARIARFEELAVVRAPAAQRDHGDLHPGGRAPRRRGDRVRERHARATATGC